MDEVYQVCPTCGNRTEVNEKTFGGRVMAARLRAELSREQLSEIMGFTNTAQVSRWENGTSGRPRDIQQAENLAKTLNVTPAWLLYGVEEPELFPDVVTDDGPRHGEEAENPITARAREIGAVE